MEKILHNGQQNKLSWKTKLLYSCGNLGTTISTVMIMGFSLYFYTEICGMNPAIASTIILIAKIWDFINDPMMGAIVDRTKSKDGKCRVYLKYFTVPAAVILALCFIMPDLTETGKIVWVAVTYTLQGMASTALSIPFNTLMARMTQDPVERAQISSWKGYFGLIGNLIAGSAAIPLVLAFGNGDMKKGFLWVGILFAVIYAVSFFIALWGTKDYDPVDEADNLTAAETTQEKRSFAASLKALVTNVPWLLTFGISFVMNLSISISGTTSLFYFQYNLGNIPMYSIVSMISLFASFAVYLVLKPMVAKFGNAKCAVIGSAVAAIGYLFRFFLHDANNVILLAGNIIGALGQVLASAMVMLIIFDCCITYGKWKNGINDEAILVSGQSLSYKVGMALSAPIAGYILAAVPYVPNAEQQEESVLNLFFYENTLLPAIGFLITMVFALILISFEKKLPMMKSELTERTEAAAD